VSHKVKRTLEIGAVHRERQRLSQTERINETVRLMDRSRSRAGTGEIEQKMDLSGIGTMRNKPCWCGSGRKMKKCCGPKVLETARSVYGMAEKFVWQAEEAKAVAELTMTPQEMVGQVKIWGKE
jgi:hypothetical protein